MSMITSIALTASVAIIPWCRPVPTPQIMSWFNDGSGGSVGDRDTMVVIARYEAGTIPDLMAFPPARRCTFPTCQTSGATGEVIYLPGYWNLLGLCIAWTLGQAIIVDPPF
jgi:hypothetical protein